MSHKHKYKGITMPDNDTTMEGAVETPKQVVEYTPTQTYNKKKDVKPTPGKTQVQEATKPIVSENVRKLNNLLDQFQTAYDNKEDTIGTLINICNYLNRTNDPKVFAAFTGWFAKNLDNGCMNCQVALRGIHTIQNKRTKTRVGATHQCFEELVRVLRSKPKSHYRFTLKAMQAMEISETLGTWVLKRAMS